MAELEGQTTIEEQIKRTEAESRRDSLKRRLKPLWSNPDYDWLPEPGWDQLLLELVNEAYHLQVAGAISIQQIKEKFGTLRFYYDLDVRLADPMGAAIFRKLVTLAEIRSEYICEECGALGGKMRTTGWHKVRCNDCQEVYEDGVSKRRAAKL